MNLRCFFFIGIIALISATTETIKATGEGEDDELVLIGEVQYHINSDVFVKINSGVGLTEKAPDVAPEVGIIFVF